MSTETSLAGAEAPSAGDANSPGEHAETSNAKPAKAAKRPKTDKEAPAADEEQKSLYPWGNKEPARRVADLEKALESLEKRRADEAEAWASRQAALATEERQLRGNLKTAQGILEKSRREAAARTVAQSVERLVASGKLDLSALSDAAGLEKKLLEALSVKA